MANARARPQPSIHLNRKKLEAVSGQHARLSLVDSVFELILGQIRNGNLIAGQRIHSVRQLADGCEVSRDTVARAYDKLVAHGHLESRAGSGFYVKHTRPRTSVQDAGAIAEPLPGWDRLRLVQPVGKHLSTTGLGLLPGDWIDEGMIGGAFRNVARANLRSLLDYADPLGYLPLRRQLQEKLKDIQIQAPVQQIMLTQGATDAVSLAILASRSNVGDVFLYEDPGPFMVIERLMAVGMQPFPVPRLADGPDLEALRQMCELHRPRFFFCSSVLHNPTSTQMAPHKAFQILRLAEEFDFTVIEDDTYSDLMPPSISNSVTRLASLDQLRRVVYIGSFSKTIAPGLRAGFLCAEPAFLERLLVCKAVSQLSGPPMTDKVVYQILSQGSYRHHCAQLRSRLDDLRLPVMTQLQNIGCTFDHFSEVGMYLWASLPGKADAKKISETMYKQGHLMAPGSLFSSDPAHRHKMRFNISRTLDSPALPALAKLLKA